MEDPPRPPEMGAWHVAVRQVTTGNALVGVLGVLLAMAVGSLLIIVTDEEVREAAGYIFARPGDFFQAAGDAISGRLQRALPRRRSTTPAPPTSRPGSGRSPRR